MPPKLQNSLCNAFPSCNRCHMTRPTATIVQGGAALDFFQLTNLNYTIISVSATRTSYTSRRYRHWHIDKAEERNPSLTGSNILQPLLSTSNSPLLSDELGCIKSILTSISIRIRTRTQSQRPSIRSSNTRSIGQNGSRHGKYDLERYVGQC